MIAHRLSTIRDADAIAVMSDGVVVEQGTYNERIAKSDGHFRRLAALQQSSGAADEDELAQAIRLSLKAEAPAAAAAATGKGGSALVRPTTAQAGHRTVADPAGRSAEGGSADHAGGVTLDTEFHFVTECFFLAARCLHHGLIPTLKATRNTNVQHGMSTYSQLR